MVFTAAEGTSEIKVTHFSAICIIFAATCMSQNDTSSLMGKTNTAISPRGTTAKPIMGTNKKLVKLTPEYKNAKVKTLQIAVNSFVDLFTDAVSTLCRENDKETIAYSCGSFAKNVGFFIIDPCKNKGDESNSLVQKSSNDSGNKFFKQ